jgi:uncharacterized Zn-finger protein
MCKTEGSDSSGRVPMRIVSRNQVGRRKLCGFGSGQACEESECCTTLTRADSNELESAWPADVPCPPTSTPEEPSTIRTVNRYACDFEGCGYRCAEAGNMRRHTRTHTGEKPLACDFEGCNNRCAQKGSLVIHKRTHTGEKPFACVFEGCNFRCTTKGYLQIHERIHASDKPYACDFAGCGFCCTNISNL